jgi:hypothetical protein
LEIKLDQFFDGKIASFCIVREFAGDVQQALQVKMSRARLSLVKVKAYLRRPEPRPPLPRETIVSVCVFPSGQRTALRRRQWTERPEPSPAPPLSIR